MKIMKTLNGNIVHFSFFSHYIQIRINQICVSISIEVQAIELILCNRISYGCYRTNQQAKKQKDIYNGSRKSIKVSYFKYEIASTAINFISFRVSYDNHAESDDIIHIIKMVSMIVNASSQQLHNATLGGKSNCYLYY